MLAWYLVSAKLNKKIKNHGFPLDHGREEKSPFFDLRPGEEVGGANWASFSGTWWVVVLTTWVGGGAGSDGGLAAQATTCGERNSF